MLNDIDTVSFDVFNTLLFQEMDLEHEIQSAIMDKIVTMLRRHACRCSLMPTEIPGLCKRIRTRLKAPRGYKPGRPEVPRREVYAELFRELAPNEDPEALGDELMHLELDVHFRLTTPNPEILCFLQACLDAKRVVIATSDTYLSCREIRGLLERHGIQFTGRIYASCEQGVDKFHGGLYRKLLAEERLQAPRLLHIGDSRMGDVWSAHQEGIKAIHYRSPGFPTLYPSGDTDPAFRLGFHLGPVFGFFGQRLLAESRHHGWDRLYFIARDGDLLRESMREIIRNTPHVSAPALNYVHFSRRSTALPAARQIDPEAIQVALDIRAPGSKVARVLAYYAIPEEEIPDDCKVKLREADTAKAMEDDCVRQFVGSQFFKQKALLEDYLRKEHMFGARSAALVDVGWRASIQTSLNRAFADDPAFLPLPGLYLGYWRESTRTWSAGASVLGVLGDAYRGRNILEAAPWHLSLVIESICRASHGTVLNYRRDADGSVTPLLASHTSAREAEHVQEELVVRIRNGVLAGVKAYAQHQPADPAMERRIRRLLQRRLLRLAFFPKRWELEILASLVHTESHSNDWSPRLIQVHRPTPWTSPRIWLAGLSSPWRGGYVAATGGPAFSAAYFCVEAVLAAFPRVQVTFRNWARQIARI